MFTPFFLNLQLVKRVRLLPITHHFGLQISQRHPDFFGDKDHKKIDISVHKFLLKNFRLPFPFVSPTPLFFWGVRG